MNDVRQWWLNTKASVNRNKSCLSLQEVEIIREKYFSGELLCELGFPGRGRWDTKIPHSTNRGDIENTGFLIRTTL